MSKSCDAKSVAFHRHRARMILRHAYHGLDGPKHSQIRSYQRHKLCIRDKDTRHSLSILRKRLKAKQEQRQFTASVTPYDCGSYGHFAIPCYVVDCESHFDWGAVNPSSGAFSAYQFLPSTYAGVCKICDRSRPDLHYAASVVWQRSGGSEWSCA